MEKTRLGLLVEGTPGEIREASPPRRSLVQQSRFTDDDGPRADGTTYRDRSLSPTSRSRRTELGDGGPSALPAGSAEGGHVRTGEVHPARGGTPGAASCVGKRCQRSVA